MLTLSCAMETQFNPQAKGWGKTFREAFCESFACPAASFEREVFWLCLHRHGSLLGKFLFASHPEWFKEDIEFIHEIGSVGHPAVFKNELNRFHGRNVRDRSWLRGTFHIRVSAKRIIQLKNRVFGLGRGD